MLCEALIADVETFCAQYAGETEAIRARTQSKIAVWTSWGRRARVRDSQEWSGTRSRLSQP